MLRARCQHGTPEPDVITPRFLRLSAYSTGPGQPIHHDARRRLHHLIPLGATPKKSLAGGGDVASRETHRATYNTYRYGSAKGGPIDAMQIEMPVDVIGDKPQDLQRAAGIVAPALAAYLERHYGWK